MDVLYKRYHDGQSVSLDGGSSVVNLYTDDLVVTVRETGDGVEVDINVRTLTEKSLAIPALSHGNVALRVKAEARLQFDNLSDEDKRHAADGWLGGGV